MWEISLINIGWVIFKVIFLKDMSMFYCIYDTELHSTSFWSLWTSLGPFTAPPLTQPNWKSCMYFLDGFTIEHKFQVCNTSGRI